MCSSRSAIDKYLKSHGRTNPAVGIVPGCVEDIHVLTRPRPRPTMVQDVTKCKKRERTGRLRRDLGGKNNQMIAHWGERNGYDGDRVAEEQYKR